MGSRFADLLKHSIDRLLYIRYRTFFHRSAVDRINVEEKWVGSLQRKLEYGNLTVLRNFKLRLVMEDD
jgi:hypothetical protein